MKVIDTLGDSLYDIKESEQHENISMMAALTRDNECLKLNS